MEQVSCDFVGFEGEGYLAGRRQPRGPAVRTLEQVAATQTGVPRGLREEQPGLGGVGTGIPQPKHDAGFEIRRLEYDQLNISGLDPQQRSTWRVAEAGDDRRRKGSMELITPSAQTAVACIVGRRLQHEIE